MHNKKSKKDKLRICLIFVSIVTLLGVLVGSVYQDWQLILENRHLEAELNLENNNLKDTEEKLSAEITKLGDNEGLINYARENFLLSTEGDIIIKWDHKNTTSKEE